VQRKIRFVLYTDQDFSNDNNNITFTLFIHNSKNEVLWDSVFAPIKINEIPGQANKVVVEKTVPNDDHSLLKAGFLYSIENVGNSWYYDSSSVGQPLKIVEFNFH